LADTIKDQALRKFAYLLVFGNWTWYLGAHRIHERRVKWIACQNLDECMCVWMWI